MDFTFSEDQDALRDAVRGFLADKAPNSYVRAMAEDDRGITDEIWNAIVEMGWTGLLVPQAQGGLGMGLVDAVVVMEEMGRLPFPGPFFSSAIFATIAANHLGETGLLEDLASGARRGTVALEEFGHDGPVERIRARVRRKGPDWVISGIKPLVLDGHTADFAIVAARTEEGIGSFLIENPQAELVQTLDPLRRVGRLEMHERPGVPIGPRGDHTRIWQRIADDVAVALAAELVGACERANQISVEYAKTRVQFGRPLATFQALRHKMVDMLHHLELARVGTHYAAWASDADDPVRAQAAAMAKAYVGEASNIIASECIQIHGGVGFTWDCDAHFFFKRAKQNDIMLGYQGWHRRRVADLLLNTA